MVSLGLKDKLPGHETRGEGFARARDDKVSKVSPQGAPVGWYSSGPVEAVVAAGKKDKAAVSLHDRWD